MTTLSQTRGDTVSYTFQRKDTSGAVIKTRPESIIFTLKSNFESNKIIVQKTIDQMSLSTDGTWRFTMEHADTAGLDYYTYVFDIQVTDRGAVTTIAKGTLTLTSEATWSAA